MGARWGSGVWSAQVSERRQAGSGVRLERRRASVCVALILRIRRLPLWTGLRPVAFECAGPTRRITKVVCPEDQISIGRFVASPGMSDRGDRDL
jgi:hypothetical protein